MYEAHTYTSSVILLRTLNVFTHDGMWTTHHHALTTFNLLSPETATSDFWWTNFSHKLPETNRKKKFKEKSHVYNSSHSLSPYPAPFPLVKLQLQYFRMWPDFYIRSRCEANFICWTNTASLVSQRFLTMGVVSL